MSSCCVLALLNIYLGFYLKRNYQEYQFIKLRNQQLQKSLEQAKRKVQGYEDYISNLEENRVFLEWVARKKLGLVASDEIIFKFDPQAPFEQ